MTEIKVLDGTVSNGKEMEPKKIVARFASDNWGEILSLEVDGQMFTVQFEPIQKMIDKARK